MIIKFINYLLIEKRALVKLAVFALADAVFIAVSVSSAFLLRFEGNIPSQHFLNMWGMIFLALIFCLPAFYYFKLYSFAWNYVSASELIALAKAVSLSFALLVVTIFLLKDSAVFAGFPRSVIFISFFLIILFSAGTRFSKRIYSRTFLKIRKKDKEPTLIVGAGDAGEQILRNILNIKESPYFPVGFVDDSQAKQGVLIHGLKVLGKIVDIPRLVKEKGVKILIVALPSAGPEIIRRAVEEGRRAGLRKIKLVPSIDELIEGGVGVRALKEVPMEDLLGRELISSKKEDIKNFIQGKKVLVTGAAGSIGSELCRQIAGLNPKYLVRIDQDETKLFDLKNELQEKFPELSMVSLPEDTLAGESSAAKTITSSVIADVLDERKIGEIFAAFKPDIVFHAAAYKHVPLMEDFPEEAVKNNVLGTKTVIEAAAKFGVEKLVFISTDKAVNPTSIMGASKRIGEMICQSQNGETKFVSVRFGNVADSRGSVIPIFKKQIEKGGPVEITHSEMKRYFMTIPEACFLVLQASAMGQGGEVFVLDMGSPIKIVDLASELIRLSGFEPDKDIPIVFTEPRPGEKFFEEILTAEEGTRATQNQKIFTARLSEVDREKLFEGIGRLEEATRNNSDRNERKRVITEIFKDLIPTYNPAKNLLR